MQNNRIINKRIATSIDTVTATVNIILKYNTKCSNNHGKVTIE